MRTYGALAGGIPMGLEFKRALFLHRNKSITEAQLFNKLMDIAIDGKVESVLRRIPAEYLCRFREWLDRLAPIETLRDVRTGSAVPKHEKEAIRAIREWFHQHQEERVPDRKEAAPSPVPAGAGPTQPFSDWSIPAPHGLVWMRELTRSPAFMYFLPKKGGGEDAEKFSQAWQGVISLLRMETGVKVGECIRHDREGLTVFFDNEPIAEFIETADREGWASLIKPNGKRVLSAGETPPPLYSAAHVESYRAVSGLRGPGVPKGMAVVLRKGDYRSVVHHAAARWLAKRELPVKPAAGRLKRGKL
jgi:hypothetical protein